MRFKTAVQLMFAQWLAASNQGESVDTPPLFLGRPGIGKTSMGRELAGLMTQHTRRRDPDAPEALFDALDLSSTLPEDLGGIPFRSQMGDITVTEFALRKRLAPFCQPNAYGVLVLDDITQAAPMVQVAARQTVLFRQLGDFKLADGVYIIITCNRREDKAGASTLPSHFRNSCCLLGIEPEVEEWCEWLGRQPNSDPRVGSFLRYRPAHLAKTPADSDKAGAFATPRSWAKLSRMMGVAEEVKVSLEVMGGLVGEGVAVEFRGFLNTRDQLVDPGLVLDDPERAMPNPGILNSPDKAYAMITGIAEVAASRRKEAAKRGDQGTITETGLKVMRALSWASQGSAKRGNREYISVGVSTYTSNGGDISDLVSAARSSKNDPLVADVLNFLAKAINRPPK